MAALLEHAWLTLLLSREAWDLLMSDVSKDSIQLPGGARLSLTPPSNLSHLQDAIFTSQSALLQGQPAGESDPRWTSAASSFSPPSIHKNQDMVQSKESTPRQQSNPQPLVDEPASRREGSPDVAKRLQDLRRDLKSLQDSRYI